MFFFISDFIWLFSLFKILRLMVSQLKNIYINYKRTFIIYNIIYSYSHKYN